MLDIHEFTSCAYEQAVMSGWSDLATEHSDFVVVWPQGTTNSSVSEDTCWDAADGYCCCYRRVLGCLDTKEVLVLDKRFIKQILADTIASSSIPIDPRRIYLTGHSNGCMMIQKFTTEFSGVVAAVGCFSMV